MRLLACLLALAAAGCADPAPDPAPGPEPEAPVALAAQTVADVVAASPRLRTLARLLEASGVGETLADTATAYTLFAPSDEAFAALGAPALAALEADPAAARAVLLDHALATRMLSADVFADLAIEAIGGAELTFAEAGEGLAVVGPAGTARITDADLDAENGVVHILDALLSTP